jgi:hypothetical protein
MKLKPVLGAIVIVPGQSGDSILRGYSFITPCF